MIGDAEQLIPELSRWNNGTGIALDAWINGVGRFDHALGYAAIFWPRFVAHENCVFRKAPDTAAYAEWMNRMSGDPAKVEAAMNHLHLIDLFAASQYAPSRPLILSLGHILKEMWSCKLGRDFPDRHFEILFQTEGDNLEDLQLTFFQDYRGSGLEHGGQESCRQEAL